MLRRRVMTGTTKIVDDSDYLTFTALEDGTFTLSIPGNVNTNYLTSVSYSLDDGATWVKTNNTSSQITITTPTVTAGSTVKWKGIGTAYSTNSGEASVFNATGSFSASGNIMSLLFGDDYRGKTKIPQSYAFYNLFGGSKKITDADNLLLPAKKLEYACYGSMFNGCYYLTTAPVLPATTLAKYCYDSMFYNCISLTTAPELPATTLVTNCYSRMFYNCNRLTTAPELPATTLANYCYYYMFLYCTGLTTAPELPATTLKTYCYGYMFYGCTKLNSVTCLGTNISSYNTYKWLYNTASSGIFTKAAGVSWPSGASGIPSGWTIIDYQE